jgi:UPF0755 protein
MEGRRFKLVLSFCLLFGLIVFSIIGYKIYSMLMLPMIEKTSAPITIIIDRNTTAADFARMLEAKGVIKSNRLFLSLIRFKGLAHRLKAGIYQITPGESALHFLYKVEAGEVLVESFRIIEGTNVNQVTANLQNAPYLKYNPNDWLPIIDHHPSAEGLLLADTYNYNAGSEARFLLRLANQKLQQYLSESWQNRSPGLPYSTPYELLIVASIIEKEAALADERKIISGVVINRIKKNMPLQMDPTVIYGLGANYKGKLTHENMSVNSLYNTYLHRGLPPTPIAMVGKAAIDAAAHPLVTNYLYYVAKGDGSHHFSATYEEQKAAIMRYQK